MSAGSGIDPITGEWSPSFAGQRRPFERGNAVAVKSGAYGVLGLTPRAREIADDLREIAPTYSPGDEPLLQLCGLTLARIEAASAALALVDETASNELGPFMVDDAAKLQRLREDLRAWIGLARRLMTDLGLGPRSRAALGADLVQTEAALTSLVEAGRRAREERTS